MIPKVFLNQSDASEEAVKELTIKAATMPCRLLSPSLGQQRRQVHLLAGLGSCRLPCRLPGLPRPRLAAEQRHQIHLLIGPGTWHLPSLPCYLSPPPGGSSD